MIYFTSDTHYGHEKCWSTFKRSDGSPLRDFSSTDEMDRTLIDNWNTTVTKNDTVKHLGDVVINRRYMYICHELQGKKDLIRGNHDIFKTREYLDVGFREIYGVWVDPKERIICSHIPIHPDSIKDGWLNIHGHLHYGRVLDTYGRPDKRYFCVSVEMTDYKPVSLEWIRERI